MSYDALLGIEWEWMATDGAMTKATLGPEKVGSNPMSPAASTPRRIDENKMNLVNPQLYDALLEVCVHQPEDQAGVQRDEWREPG